MILPDTILEDIILIAKRAGAFIRKERENFDYGKVEIKGLNDLVSYVDKTAEEMIVSYLHTLLPEAGFIVEENTRSEKKEYNWIVDPLDGTTNFVHGIPCYSVSIALEHRGEIRAGVVYEVSRDECFFAQKGKGAFLNHKAIYTSSRKTLSESLIATGFPIYNFSRINPYMACLHYFMEHTHGVRRIGSAATDLCYLACGRVDAFFEYNLNAWDIAAGALIVKEAGGTVTDFSGKENWLFGREISCTNSLLDEEFNGVIKKNFNAPDVQESPE
ncbi:MAG: inositol monophosphatase family protein [bacterium]|nr:inositol monophosphatase family protein [bacterium]